LDVISRSKPDVYDPSDWQLAKTALSYEGLKFQMDLAAHQLDQASLHEESDGLPVRNLTVLPGVAGMNIASALLGTLSSISMFLAFYIVSYH
jgi:3-keto steroid reductase